MSFAAALLLFFAIAAVMLIGLFFGGAFDKVPTAAEEFFHSYAKREVDKALRGAANAEQWAKDLVAKAEKHFK